MNYQLNDVFISITTIMLFFLGQALWKYRNNIIKEKNESKFETKAEMVIGKIEGELKELNNVVSGHTALFGQRGDRLIKLETAVENIYDMFATINNKADTLLTQLGLQSTQIAVLQAKLEGHVNHES